MICYIFMLDYMNSYNKKPRSMPIVQNHLSTKGMSVSFVLQQHQKECPKAPETCIQCSAKVSREKVGCFIAFSIISSLSAKWLIHSGHLKTKIMICQKLQLKMSFYYQKFLPWGNNKFFCSFRRSVNISLPKMAFSMFFNIYTSEKLGI